MNLIDREELREHAFTVREFMKNNPDVYVVSLKQINHAPTIDAIEIVRCKDCACYGKSPFGHPAIGWCRIDGKHRGQNFYCANGERKNMEV